MNLDADIVPGRSIAGLTLGEDALELIVRLQQQHSVKEIPGMNPNFARYEIDEALRLVVDSRDFKIVELAALVGYRRPLFGYVRAGMSVRELIVGAPSALLKQIHLFNDMLYLDRAESVGFLLPPQYDDFDRIDDLPGDFVLDALHVVPPTFYQARGRDGKLIWRMVGVD